jgi:MFS family permease
MTYVSHWFDRRRGTALALISSGQYMAGALWPPIFERARGGWVGWRQTMLLFGLYRSVIVPLAAIFLRAPAAPSPVAAGTGGRGERPAAG